MDIKNTSPFFLGIGSRTKPPFFLDTLVTLLSVECSSLHHWNFLKKSSALFLCALLLQTPGRAANTADPDAFNISPELYTVIKTGLDDLYNFDFENAHRLFDSVKDQSEAHPMIPFGKASAEWWRISALVLEADPEESKPFLEYVNTCIDLTEKKIDAGDKTGEAHLVLGGALGLLGRWEATNRQWMSAYRHGKRADKLLRQALEINPRLKDAYMGMGVFDYFVATLPALVRFLAFIGKGGNKEVGLNELHIAADESTFAKTPSKLFLSQIYTWQEKKPQEALPILTALHAEYPKSSFIHMIIIIALYSQGDLDAMKTQVDTLQKGFADGLYQKAYEAQASFALGAYYFKQKKWTEAAEAFQTGTTVGAPKDPWQTWSLLYWGYCLDMLGQRDQAKAHYTEVLKRLRRWSSHENAEERLKKPFKETDNELNELDL